MQINQLRPIVLDHVYHMMSSIHKQLHPCGHNSRETAPNSIVLIIWRSAKTGGLVLISVMDSDQGFIATQTENNLFSYLVRGLIFMACATTCFLIYFVTLLQLHP